MKELIAQALMSPEWALVLVTGGGIGLGVVLNFVIVAYYVGGYRKVIEDLKEDFSAHMQEYNDFRRRYAALTGDSNGHD